MSTLNRTEQVAVGSSPKRLRRLRGAAVGLSAVVGILYGALLVVVRGVESDATTVVTDSTYGAYLFLAIAYLLSAGAYAVLDRRTIWLAGAALQVVVIALFLVFGVGLFGPGLFDYEALAEATSVVVWAAVVIGLQVVLLVLLGYLATLRSAGRHAA